MGFKTFGTVIDESYDNESDALVRWRMAWEQMCWLADQPQHEILRQIQPIVEHNYEVIMNTNWAETFRQQFEKDLARIIAG